MDFKTMVGKIIKILLPKNLCLPVLKGKLIGKKWIVSSANIECLLGIYEKEKMELFEKSILKNYTVYDIGAHVGYYSLLASVLVSDKGKVIAFEPVPNNIRYLKQHIKLNSCKNIKIIEAAVSVKKGTARFNDSIDSYLGHLSENGDLSVKMVFLDELVKDGELPVPDLIKIDVEGAEFSVLKGAELLLTNHSPKIFLATHDHLIKDIHTKCCNYLISLGYKIEPIGGEDIYKIKEIIAYKKPRNMESGE